MKFSVEVLAPTFTFATRSSKISVARATQKPVCMNQAEPPPATAVKGGEQTAPPLKKKRVRTGPLLHCDIPGCTYASIHRQNLTRHKAGKHNINVTWYACDLCPYKAKQKSDLKDHKAAIHYIDVVWLPCTVPGCPYRAKRRRALTEHLADRHLINLKWWPCTVPGCTYRAKRKQALELHEAAMHNINVRWHNCSRPGCAYRSMQTSNLRRHEMSHDLQLKKAEERLKKQELHLAVKLAKKKSDESSRKQRKEQATLRKKQKDSLRYFANKKMKLDAAQQAKSEACRIDILCSQLDSEQESTVKEEDDKEEARSDEEDITNSCNSHNEDSEDDTFSAFPPIPGY